MSRPPTWRRRRRELDLVYGCVLVAFCEGVFREGENETGKIAPFLGGSQRRRKRRPGRTFPFVRRARRRRSQTDGGCPLLPTVTNAFFCVTGGRCATPPVRPGPVNDGRCSGGVFSDRVGRSSRPTYDHIKVGRGQQKAATDATKQND